MKLVDFLILLLETQAQTLQRLAAFFGEEELLHMLESAGEKEEKGESSISIEMSWIEPSRATESSSAYTQLESSVRDINLPAVLEFHLWAYPFYRSIIESSLDLRSTLRRSEDHAVERLLNECILQAKLWIKNLPIHPDQSAQAERIAMIPWLRFRTEVLKKIGKRPIASL